MRALAGAEFRLLARSPFAIVMAGLLPAAVGMLIVWAEQDTGRAGWGGAAGLLLVTLVTFTAYTGGTTTLAARRQQFVLKRLRMSGARDATILGAVLLPLAALTLVQTAVLMGILVAAGRGPSRPWLLVAAAVTGTAAGCVLAVVTAVVTPAPELAQLTTSPIAIAFLGGGFWAVRTPADDVSWAMLAVPGVSVTQLTRAAWEGGSGVLGAITVVAALSLVVAPLAVRAFAWDPRR
ncbi:ABC transporter permease [Actinoplanes sp. NPDC049548]|uniref:ABC transporter permease n=1 Tax=Actinoplanes sp. NPDC049548 TaxID=3155152 RepID=UPI0034314721